MVTNWGSWLRGLWAGVRFLVAGARSSGQQLPVVVEPLSSSQYYFLANGEEPYRDPDDVLRLLYRDSESETGGPGPFSPERAWTVEDTYTGPVPSNGGACPDCTSRYGKW